MDIKIDVPNGGMKEVVFEPTNVLTYNIDLPCTLLGFFENGFSKNDNYIMCLIQTDDN